MANEKADKKADRQIFKSPARKRLETEIMKMMKAEPFMNQDHRDHMSSVDKIYSLYKKAHADKVSRMHPMTTDIASIAAHHFPGLVIQKNLVDAITAVFPKAIVQTCIVHLIRHSLSFVSWQRVCTPLDSVMVSKG